MAMPIILSAKDYSVKYNLNGGIKMNNQTGCFAAMWMFIWNIIKHSGIYKILTKIYSAISNGWNNSRIAGWFRTLHIKGGVENSIAGRVLRLPFTLIEVLQKKIGISLKTGIEKSLFLNICRTYADNVFALNLRFIGIVMLIAGLIVGMGNAAIGGGIGILNLIVVAAGVLLTIANVNFTDYLKHSALVKLVCTLLDIEPDFNWYNNDNTKTSLRYITAVLSGIILGVLGAVLNGMVLGLPGIFVSIGGAIGAAALILIFKKPIAGVFCLIFAAPILPTMADVGLAILCIMSLIIYALTTLGFKFKYDGAGFFVLMFLCIYAVSAVTSFTPKKSISICAIYFVFILMYFVIINTVVDKKKLKGLLTMFVMSGVLVCLYGIAQYLFGWDTSQAWMDENMFEDIKMRIYSTLGNPNVLGEYILLVLPASIGLMWTAKKFPAKVVYAGISAMMFGALILTFSRGCWIGILVAAAIFITFAAGKLWGLGLIALPIIPMILPESIINRFSSIGNMDDSSTSYRVYIWMGTLAMMKDFWLSGIGMGQQAFTAVYPFYSYNGIIAPHAHNLFLQILVECGIAGIAVFLIALFLLIRRVMVGYQAGGKGHPLSVCMTALTAGLCGFLVQGMFDNCFYNYRVMLVFWGVAAMIRACVHIAEDSAKTENCDK